MPDNLQGFLHTPITAAQPSDVVLSPDGSILYVANTAGQVLVYDVVTRTLIATWNVGNNLGGIDIAPDGSFLLVAEREPVAHHPATGTTDASTTLTAYMVETATGAVTDLPVTINGHQYAGFYDVEVFNDGRARLTHEDFNLPVRELDIASGEYSIIGPSFSGEGVLVGSIDHTQALFTSNLRFLPSELAVFESTGSPIARWTGHQAPGHTSPGSGIIAFSLEAGLIVQHQYIEWQGTLGTSLLVFDQSLASWFDLVSLHPEWADGRISGLAFDATGANLFVLDDDTDTIVQLSTSDWSVIRSFQVGTDIGDFADGHFGNRLLITSDSRYFTVVTATGVQLVENDAFANNFIGSGAADILSGGLGDDVISGVGGNDHLKGDSGNDTLSGGDGDDLIQGGTGTDTLTGGPGNDTFQDTASDLSKDTITDLAAGDRIVITDATLAGFTFNLSGNTLTYTGGSLTLSSVPTGILIARAAADGGVELLIAPDVRNDFNGDGRSDILWRNVDGQMSNWLGTTAGGFTPNNANAAAVVPVAWQIAGTGDFNGDGRDDILWRHTDGTLSNWLATAAGGYVANDANAAVVVPTDWHVVGTGDFNGDGRDDILWRHNDGTISNWLGTAAGGFVANDANAAAPVPTAWHVAGVGDFNGDGRDDILWRNDDGQLSNWLGTTTGGFTPNNANAAAVVPTAWQVIGTGDFNGDGRDDILWRHTDGTLSNWLGTAAGGFTPNDTNAAVAVPLAWSVVAVGDYNGDGRDDILWRHTDGTLSNWLGTATGGFTPNDANAATPVPVSWEVQPESFLL